MKSLVVYTSKRGTTEECAVRIANRLKSDTLDLNRPTNINLNDYDLIIIGTPIYMGMILKKVNNFIIINQEILLNKRIAFFICGIDDQKEMINIFKRQVNIKLINKAITIRHFGGELHPDKAHFLMKSLMKKMILDSKFQAHINGDEISKFISDVVY